MAHSDSEMMRMTTEPFDVSMQDGEPPVYLIQMVFDEGITLHGALLIETNELRVKFTRPSTARSTKNCKRTQSCSTSGLIAKRREPRGI